MVDTTEATTTPSIKRQPPPFHGVDALVRTLVRPCLTVGGVAVWVYGFLNGKEVPDAFVAMVVAAWGTWFAERAIKNLRK